MKEHRISALFSQSTCCTCATLVPAEGDYVRQHLNILKFKSLKVQCWKWPCNTIARCTARTTAACMHMAIPSTSQAHGIHDSTPSFRCNGTPELALTTNGAPEASAVPTSLGCFTPAYKRLKGADKMVTPAPFLPSLAPSAIQLRHDQASTWPQAQGT